MHATDQRPTRVIIVGGGVAGTEFGTDLGNKAHRPIAITTIEASDARRYGGWGFQGFPITERTNLSLEKM